MNQSLHTGYNVIKSKNHWFAFSCLAILAILFLTNWPNYHHQILGGPEPLVYFILACIMAAGFVLINPGSLILVFREPVFYWYIFHSVSGILWIVMLDDGYLDPDSNLWRLRFLFLFLFAATTVMAGSANSHKLAKVWLGCAVFAAICFWIEFFNPHYFVPYGSIFSNPGRSSGWFMNANGAAGVLAVACVAIVPFASQKWRILLILIATVGVFPTFSRSVLLYVGLVLVLWFWSGQFNKKVILVLAIVLPLSAVISSELFKKATDSPEVNQKDILERVDFFQGKKATDHSAEERQYVAEKGWAMFAERPLLGYGTGNIYANSKLWAYPQSTHNIYLLLLLEQGIIGFFSFFFLLSTIFTRGIRLYRNSSSHFESDLGISLVLIACYFAFIGLFSHNVLMESGIMLPLASLLVEERKIAAAKEAMAKAEIS